MSPNLSGLLIKKGTFGHRDTHRGKMMWRELGRMLHEVMEALGLCCHKTRNVWGYQNLEEARKDPPTTAFRGNMAPEIP